MAAGLREACADPKMRGPLAAALPGERPCPPGGTCLLSGPQDGGRGTELMLRFALPGMGWRGIPGNPQPGAQPALRSAQRSPGRQG